MKAINPPKNLFLVMIAILTILCHLAAAQKNDQPPLNEQGKKLEAHYSQSLQTLHDEIRAQLPELGSQKKNDFLMARAELAKLVAPNENAAPEIHKAYQTSKTFAEANALDTARKIFADLHELLSSNDLDSKLMRAAILRHATPRGLAEFAQQGDAEKELLDKLFADEKLMMQMR